MRRVVLRLWGCAIGVAVLVLGMTPATVAAQEDEGTEQLILAFYHAEIGWDTWSETLCDQPETLYVSANDAAVDRHLAQAQSAGIDAFVQAWYGPELGDNLTEPNLAMLLRQAEGYDVAVAVLLDVTAEGYLMTGNDVAAALIHLRDVHQSKPTYLRVDGRPVVFFLGQQRFSLASWEAIRNQVDPAHEMIWIAEARSATDLDLFEGLYLYEIADRLSGDLLTPLHLDRWGAEVRQWQVDHGVSRYWVATVYPGYDDRYCRECAVDSDEEEPGIVRSRQGGNVYRESWDAAVDSAPDWVVIRSYNEWELCTHIEPSLLYGDSYLDLTQELIQRYRQPATPTPMPTPTSIVATPTLTPTITPTVTLPTPALTETLEATMTATPTATLVPTATPFRLATPTPTLAASDVVQTHDVEDIAAPLETISPGGMAGPVATLTPTPLPRLPVEGGAPGSCMWLPLWLTAMVVVGSRWRMRPPE